MSGGCGISLLRAVLVAAEAGAGIIVHDHAKGAASMMPGDLYSAASAVTVDSGRLYIYVIPLPYR